jgi:hypothetical protein
MNADARAPSSWHVIRAISRRELGIAWRRKLVRLLFLMSIGPPLVFGVILVVRILAEQASGFDLQWDPVLWFLRVQVAPVSLLALGLGTPLVARDRAEDVLYLYAVRPVSPWHYAAGKMLAVALPAFLLLLVPAVLIAVLRRGLMPEEVNLLESLGLVAKVALVAIFVAGAYAGVSVGPSAATKRARWALLIAIAFYVLPDSAMQIFTLGGGFAVGPSTTAEALLESLFESHYAHHWGISLAVLSTYAVVGTLVTMFRVRKEMTP